MTFVDWAVSGIDVSRWQGEINWETVADGGYKYAGIRASVGNFYTDPRFEENFDGALINGIIPLPYHVIRPDHDVASNLGRFQESLNGREASGYVLDVELHGGQGESTVKHRTHWLLRGMQDAWPENEIIVYTANWFWTPWIGEGKTNEIAAGWPSDYALWIAHYYWPTVQAPKLPIGWRGKKLWKIWQHTSRGKVPGIKGNVDQDFMKLPFFAKLGGDDEPIPEPRLPIEIRVPAGKADVTVTEV